MAFKRCPGSAAFAQPKIELVRCPRCGGDVEVWSDEADGKCPKCGETACRTDTHSCIDWCKYARECLGDEAHKKYQDLKTRLRKEALLKAADEYLADESLRVIARTRVAFAESILSKEPAADPNVVVAAAALSLVGAPVAGESLLSGPAKEERANERTGMVDGILHNLGYPEGFIKEVCGILNRSGESDKAGSINSRIVHDAIAFSEARGNAGDAV